MESMSRLPSSTRTISGDQISGFSVPAMAFFGALNKLVYIQCPSKAGIKRTFASVDLHAQAPQLFDMRKQLPADSLLIGFRKRGNLVDGVFHYFGHV
jgi:hypothetical protein